ncbi:heavy-metal-associated domain-containing protein [Botrimarina sp.]|uniref:heavy-metal-associated domain-containing protein n=1 Tax=Botrimarina sp. TaxID=2795802 RepID=UPI0032EFCEED
MQRRTWLTIAAMGVLFVASQPGLAAEGSQPQPLAPGIVQVTVEDLHCATCARKAARKLYAVKGVRKVTASLANDTLVITLPADRQAPVASLWRAVTDAELKPVSLRWADQSVDRESIKPLLASRPANAVAR